MICILLRKRAAEQKLRRASFAGVDNSDEMRYNPSTQYADMLLALQKLPMSQAFLKFTVRFSTSASVTPPRYSRTTRLSPSQTGSVRQKSQRSQTFGS